MYQNILLDIDWREARPLDGHPEGAEEHLPGVHNISLSLVLGNQPSWRSITLIKKSSIPVIYMVMAFPKAFYRPSYIS